MNRNDLRVLAGVRLREARVLLQARCFDEAYYLSGYAVECALKACIAKQTRRHDFPEKKTNDSYNHNLSVLVEVAGLRDALKLEADSNPNFALNWNTLTGLTGWSENRRYCLNTSKDARDLYRAIAARQHGVMRWIRRFW